MRDGRREEGVCWCIEMVWGFEGSFGCGQIVIDRF